MRIYLVNYKYQYVQVLTTSTTTINPPPVNNNNKTTITQSTSANNTKNLLFSFNQNLSTNNLTKQSFKHSQTASVLPPQQNSLLPELDTNVNSLPSSVNVNIYYTKIFFSLFIILYYFTILFILALVSHNFPLTIYFFSSFSTQKSVCKRKYYFLVILENCMHEGGDVFAVILP